MKSTGVSYLLWIVGGLGVLGLHRFYLGRWVTGIIWLLTGGLFLIGAILDLVLIPGMVQVENLSQQLIHEQRGRPWPGRAPLPAAMN
jgi:TM2 domain-containing membrane protein YozV